MKSMTGYVSIEHETDELQVIVEIKGYNSRYLDLALILPPGLQSFEGELRMLTVKHCKRGKIDITIRVKEKKDNGVSINYEALDRYIKLCAGIAAYNAGITAIPVSDNQNILITVENKINVISLLRCEGVLETKKNPAANETWNTIKPVLETAFLQFDSERKREGAHTKTCVISFLEEIENSVKKIKDYIPETEALIRTNIRRRFEELSLESADENRILAEVAFLLMKYTIAEEVNRLEGHLAEFRRQLSNNISLGKKLDFLTQEIVRETNTIGAKTPLFAVSTLVVSMKDAAENIREQIRNIE